LFDVDTSLGGRSREFPETTWGLVCRVSHPKPEERLAGLETLCRRYWKPVYYFCRGAWAKTNEEAKDLTQDFFSWLLEGEVLSRYAPGRGSFRAYLKGLLRNFSGNQHQAMNRIKRGGGARRFSLPEEAAAIVPDPRARTPEEEFDRVWLAEVVRLATERARADLGESIPWKVFEEYDLRDAPERPTYEEVARRLGLKESDVRNHLYSIRGKVREFIREALRETVGSEEEVQEEWNVLFGS